MNRLGLVGASLLLVAVILFAVLLLVQLAVLG